MGGGDGPGLDGGGGVGHGVLHEEVQQLGGELASLHDRAHGVGGGRDVLLDLGHLGHEVHGTAEVGRGALDLHGQAQHLGVASAAQSVLGAEVVGDEPSGDSGVGRDGAQSRVEAVAGEADQGRVADAGGGGEVRVRRRRC